MNLVYPLSPRPNDGAVPEVLLDLLLLLLARHFQEN